MKLCKCGKEHKSNTKHTMIGENVLLALPDVIMESGCEHVLLVADSNTYGLTGQKVAGLLHRFHVREFIYEEKALTPDERAIGRLMIATQSDGIGASVDMIIALGTGTINDLCRYVSFRLGIPYIIVATAPSMDGYASNVSPLIVKGLKTTYEATVAYAIIGDTALMSTAPAEMISAGFGDIIGKYTCLNDWMLGKIVNDEYYCEYVAAITRSSIETCVGHVNGLSVKTADSIESLMNGLVLSGVAMSYAGNSRPASGAEHHLSHFWEMMFLFDGRSPVLHGVKVGVATLAMIKMCELLVATPVDWEAAEKKAGQADSKEYSRTIERIFQQAAAGILTAAAKTGRNSRDNTLKRLTVYRQSWSLITQTIQQNIPRYETVKTLLQKAGCPVSPVEIGVSRDEFISGVCCAKEIRQRYTVLQMAADLGMVSAYAEILANFFYDR